jgi:membrane protein implicated in regulation of membrane protease activity
MMPDWALTLVFVLAGGMVALAVLSVVAWMVLAAYMRRADRRQVARVEAKLMGRLLDTAPPSPRAAP